MQEFPERLRILTRNCEIVRGAKVRRREEGRKVRLLPSLAFMYALPQALPRSAFCIHHPCIPSLIYSTCCMPGLPNTCWQYQQWGRKAAL